VTDGRIKIVPTAEPRCCSILVHDELKHSIGVAVILIQEQSISSLFWLLVLGWYLALNNPVAHVGSYHAMDVGPADKLADLAYSSTSQRHDESFPSFDPMTPQISTKLSLQLLAHIFNSWIIGWNIPRNHDDLVLNL
jgi:hypothetical protein